MIQHELFEVENFATKMNTLELIRELERLICPAYEPKFDKPVWADSMVWITNGHLAIAFTEQEEELPEWCHNPSLVNQLQTVIKPGKRVSFSLPELKPETTWLTPNKHTKISCPECGGTGIIECNYGHEHDCEECNGKGISEDVLIVEWLNKPANERNYETNIGVFDRRYLWVLSEIAKQREITYSVRSMNPGVMLFFAFEDGYGGLMSIVDRRKTA